MRCRGPPPTGGEQRVEKPSWSRGSRLAGAAAGPANMGVHAKRTAVPEAPSLRNCLLFITILLVILVFSGIRENKGFRHRDKHRQRRQSISWIDCYTMSLMCLRIFLGSSCGNPKLSRRDADDPLEVKAEMALIREAGAVRDLREAELAVCSQEELRSFNAPRDHILIRG